MRNPSLFAVLLMTMALAGACATSPRLASVASQAPGAVAGLVDVALAAPVDDRTREQIAAYGRWANLAAEAAAGVGQAMTASEGVRQAAGTVQAVNRLVQQAPVDEAVKAKASGWADWAMLAIRAAATIAPLVL